MNSDRRRLLAGLTTVCAAGITGARGQSASTSIVLPAAESIKAELFPQLSGSYLDCASHHPMIAPSSQAIQDYAQGLSMGYAPADSAVVRAKFAQLINAEADEIVYAPSTSLGENLITRAIDLPARGGRIITDALHFIGSFYLYEQLGKQGMDVVVLPIQEDGSISYEQYASAITDDARLLAVSHISWINGFQHDLKALADLAHAHGAYLYADIMQSAGNTPIDAKAMGIDFACCGTYKWLMGDFGLAFLYANKNRVPELVSPWYGYLQTNNFVTPATHLYPFDAPGSPAYTSAPREGVAGIFNGSFPPRMIEAGASVSLGWLLETGVETLQRARQPMLEALQTQLRERGFRPYTPADSTSPIVSFIYRDASRLNEQLAGAQVTISTYTDRFRISPSFFNDMNDIDRVIEALGRA